MGKGGRFRVMVNCSPSLSFSIVVSGCNIKLCDPLPPEGGSVLRFKGCASVFFVVAASVRFDFI